MRAGGYGAIFDIHGTHRVDSLMSNTTQNLALGINSELSFLTLFSSECDMCKVNSDNGNDHVYIKSNITSPFNDP